MGTSLREDPAKARRVLNERRAEVARSLGQVEGAAVAVDADPQRVGGTSRLDELQQREIAGDAARRRRRELLRIDSALERVESGEYGYCLACGAPIPEARLALDPAAVLCLPCAERA
jgi:DnaK suppressor protein